MIGDEGLNENTLLLGRDNKLYNSNSNINKQKHQHQHHQHPHQHPYSGLPEVKIPNNVWYIILSLWVGSFLSAADTTIVSTTANTIASSMNGSELLTWIAASYLITNTIFQPLVGRFSDIFGRRTVLLIAQFWFALGCLCCALAQNVVQFSIARALAGIGGGGMSALSSIITTDIIPLRMRGMYQGYSNLVYAIGQFVGPVVGSLFLTVDEKSGWRWMFAVQVPLVIIAAFLVFYNVHDYREGLTHEIDMKNRFSFGNLRKVDLPGSLLLSCAIVSFLLLFSATSQTQFYFYLGGIFLSSFLFFVVENYIVTVHVIPQEAFKGILKITAFIICFGAMAMNGTSYLLPLYLQIVHDFNQLQLGIFNAFGVFAVAAGSLLAGWYLKHEEHVKAEYIVQRSIRLSIFSCIGIFIGSFICMFSILNFKPTFSRVDISYFKVSVILIGFVLTAIGYGSFLVALLILVVGKVGAKHQATVTGMNYMFRSMGISSGVGAVLGLYNHILVNELTAYFVKKNKPDGEKILKTLLNSTFYIRDGLPNVYVKKVLKIYRESVGDSIILIFVMASTAFVLSLFLNFYPSKKSSRNNSL